VTRTRYTVDRVTPPLRTDLDPVAGPSEPLPVPDFVLMIGTVTCLHVLSACLRIVCRALGTVSPGAARPQLVRALAIGLTVIVLLSAGLEGTGAASPLGSAASLHLVSRDGDAAAL